MRKLLYSVLLLVSGNGFGQNLTLPYADTTFEGQEIQIQSVNYYTSKRFDNELTDRFLFGGTITPEMKNRVSERLNGINTLGAEAGFTIAHYNGDLTPLKNKSWGLTVAFSDQHVLSSNIADDLFKIAMYGNAGTVGDTMNFGFTHLQYLHFQKIGVGLFSKDHRSSIRLNYIIGSKGVEGRLNDTRMLSQTDSISLWLQGTGYATDRFYPYWAFQGSGAGVDLTYNFQLTSRKGNLQIVQVQINNLGFMYWNQSTDLYAVDSSFTFTGYNVNDFINAEETPTYNYNDTLGVRTDKNNRLVSLPTEFILQKLPLRYSDQKLQYTLGFKALLVADYFPYFYGGLYYSPLQQFSASTRLSYGGFGGFQWGVQANYWAKDKFHVGLGSSNLLGFFSKKHGYGRSVNLSVQFKL